MRTMLVVDDESIQRRVLSNIIRNLRPTCLVLEASNGKKALEIVNSQPIDIIITDVKMPIMNGFDFIENITERFSNIKIIILSGYRYFEYAQKAIKLGAFDYLLKPIKEETIFQMLEKVEASIEKEKLNMLEKENLKKQLNHTLPVYYEHLLNDWINSNVTEDKSNEIKQYFSIEKMGVVIVSKINKKIPNDSLLNMEKIRNSMISEMNQILDPIGHSITFFSSDDKNKMITVLTAYQISQVLLKAITDLLNVYKHSAINNYGIDFTIGIGSICDDILNEVKKSYETANLATSYKFYFFNVNVLNYTNIANSIYYMQNDLSKDEEILKEVLRQMKNDSLDKSANEIFERILEQGYPFPDQLIKKFVHLVNNIGPVIKDFVEEEQYNAVLLDMQSQLTECTEYDAFKNKFIECLHQFVKLIQDARSKKHELIMNKCIVYIDTHYMEDLSLETIANQLFFSPNYLSIVFKNYLGMTFSKYLSQIRINNALELLENSEFKVYEIASKVGFNDDKYFYRVFKRRFGLTPDEFRRINVKIFANSNPESQKLLKSGF